MPSTPIVSAITKEDKFNYTSRSNGFGVDNIVAIYSRKAVTTDLSGIQ
jgi:hypothetical protein